jgi:hypothetical protein
MPEDAKDLKKLKRDELDDVAADHGVPAPEELPNKDAVIEAIEAPNPALAPPPPPPRTEQTYKVVGPVPVHDTKPGGEFTALLSADQEAHLIEAGHIIVKQNPED